MGVLEALLDASGFAWTEEMLIDTIDKGNDSYVVFKSLAVDSLCQLFVPPLNEGH